MLSLDFGKYTLFEEEFTEHGGSTRVYGIEYRDPAGNSICKAKAVSSVLEEMNLLTEYFMEFRVPVVHFMDILEDFITEKHSLPME